MNTTQWTERVQEEAFVESIRLLYGEKAEENRERYVKLLDLFRETFGEREDVSLFSAPGRTEIGGNQPRCQSTSHRPR